MLWKLPTKISKKNHKIIITYKGQLEMLRYAFNIYCITVKTSTRIMPYYLVYKMKAVMHLEIEISYLKVLIEFELEESKWAKICKLS
jgi:hypothetical protein